MKKKKYYLILFFVICIIFGCDKNGTKEEINTMNSTKIQNAGTNNIATFDWLPTTKNEDEILLYDKFDQRILSYNTKTNSIVTKNETKNYLQYEFNNLACNIYTTGHSIENHYKIIEKEEKEIKVLYEMEKNEAIFPLFYENYENMYFLKTLYTDAGEELYKERVVCKFNAKTKELAELEETKGIRICSATLIDNILYMTVYDSKADKYKLYQMDASTEKGIDMVSEGLVSEDIYNNNGRLWVSDNTEIYDYNNKQNRFTKKTLNYFSGDQLLQIGVNTNGDLQLTITNTKTNEIDNITDNIIDVRISNSKIYVYTSQKIIVI